MIENNLIWDCCDFKSLEKEMYYIVAIHKKIKSRFKLHFTYSDHV